MEEKVAERKKYTVKPPKDLSSKYVKMMEERRIKKEEEEAARRKAEEEARIAVCIPFHLISYLLIV